MSYTWLKQIFLGLLILVSFSLIGNTRLNINVICYRNGVGLNRDIDLLMEELSHLGHNVMFVNVNDHSPREQADINVFVDTVDEFFFPMASKNYLIPNPEWCFLPSETIARFDKILCKTKEALRIFHPLNPHSEFMSFTCKDRYDEGAPKNYKSPLHLVGASIQKGTESVVRTWMANPQFPDLLLIKHKGEASYPPTSNLNLVYGYLTDANLKTVQNICGLHICTSETEGFGHYLFEAFSCGNVVITTDAPPMNEFITDPRCLVKYLRSAPWRKAVSYFVDPTHLDRVIGHLLSLPEEELRAIGQRNREFYLQNDRFFKQRLAEIFPPPRDDINY